MSYEVIGKGGDDPAASGMEGPPWKLIAIGVVVAVLVVFLAQNGNDAKVEFLWIDVEMPIWTVIAISVIVGAGLDRLVGWQWRRRRHGGEEQ